MLAFGLAKWAISPAADSELGVPMHELTPPAADVGICRFLYPTAGSSAIWHKGVVTRGYHVPLRAGPLRHGLAIVLRAL